MFDSTTSTTPLSKALAPPSPISSALSQSRLLLSPVSVPPVVPVSVPSFVPASVPSFVPVSVPSSQLVPPTINQPHLLLSAQPSQRKQPPLSSEPDSNTNSLQAAHIRAKILGDSLVQVRQSHALVEADLLKSQEDNAILINRVKFLEDKLLQFEASNIVSPRNPQVDLSMSKLAERLSLLEAKVDKPSRVSPSPSKHSKLSSTPPSSSSSSLSKHSSAPPSSSSKQGRPAFRPHALSPPPLFPEQIQLANLLTSPNNRPVHSCPGACNCQPKVPSISKGVVSKHPQ